MTKEIEYVTLENDNEVSETCLQVRITRFKNNPSKLKFDVIWATMKGSEQDCLKQFLYDKVIKENYDKKFSIEEIRKFKEELNKK